MVKVTGPDDSPRGRGNRSKGDPIITRSVAAKEASGQNGSPQEQDVTQPYRSTRLQQRVASCTGLNVNGDAEMRGPDTPTGSEDSIEVKHDMEVMDDRDDDISKSSMVLNDISSHKLHTVHENDVKIEIAVTDDKEGSVTMPTTVANTDVTKPLMIQTKFAHSSPGPGSESTDTASEIGSYYNSPICSTTTSGQCSPNDVFPSKFTSPPSSVKESISKMDLAEKLSHVRDLEAQFSGRSGRNAGHCGSGAGEVEVKAGDEEVPVTHTEESPESRAKAARGRFPSQQGFTPKVSAKIPSQHTF